MADIAGRYYNSSGYYPRFTYDVSYGEIGRNGSSVTYRFTVSYSKDNYYGYDIQVNWSVGGASGRQQLKSTADIYSGSTVFDVTCSTDSSGGTIGAQIWTSSNTDSTHWQNSFDTGGRTVSKSTWNTAPSQPGEITIRADNSSGAVLTGTIPENINRFFVSWGASSDPNGDTIYYDLQEQRNNGSWVSIDGSGTDREHVFNTSGGEGTIYYYAVEARDNKGGRSSWRYSNKITKNVLTGGQFTGYAPAIYYDTTSIKLTFSGGSNTDGTAAKYMVYSDSITVYNTREVTTTSETITIWKSGALPSTPYIKFEDIKKWCENNANSYKGSFSIALRTGNGRNNYRYAGSTIAVDLATNPNPATSVTPQANSQSTNILGSYFVPRSEKYTKITWNAGSDPLGTAVSYAIFVRYDGGSWQQLGTTTGLFYNHEISEVKSKTVAQYLVRTIAAYGNYSDATSSSIDLHFYNGASFSPGDIRRTATSAECNFTVNINSSIPSVGINGTWVCTLRGSSTAVSQGSIANSQASQKINATNLEDSKQYEVTFTYNDATGFSSNRTAKMQIGVNSPIVFINRYGLGAGGAKADSDNVINAAGNIFTTGFLQKNAVSASWIDGAKGSGVLVNMPSKNGYNTIMRQKTTNGVWNFGTYTSDDYLLTYFSDETIAAGTNTPDGQISFPARVRGTVYTTGNKPQPNDIGALSLSGGTMEGGAKICWDVPGDSACIYAENYKGFTTLYLETADDGDSDCIKMINRHYSAGIKEVATFGRDEVNIDAMLKVTTGIQTPKINNYEFQGYNSSPGKVKNTIATIKSDGVMEIGQYIDFHTQEDIDYTMRLTCESAGSSSFQCTGDTNVLFFRKKNGDRYGYIGNGTTTNEDFFLWGDVRYMRIGADGHWIFHTGHTAPYEDNSWYLGAGWDGMWHRWKVVYAMQGTISGSDAVFKENMVRLNGNSVVYDEENDTVTEQPRKARIASEPKASSKDYYDFFKDRFKPTYYKYKNDNVAILSEDDSELAKQQRNIHSNQIGFIAQDYDIETDLVAKEFIVDTGQDYMYDSMCYVTSGMIALQEAIGEIEKLKQENENLKSEIAIIKEKIGI